MIARRKAGPAAVVNGGMSLRLFLLLLSSGVAVSQGAVIEIRTPAELTRALAKPVSGDVWKIHPGDYPGGHFVSGIDMLTIEAADPQKPPSFNRGGSAWQFTRCPGLTLRNLSCHGQTGNGFNLDDGGPDRGDVPGIILENLTISDIGPIGNFDSIKCSGLCDLTIRGCRIEGWGGQAIDLVGCHRVLITDCQFKGKPGFSQHSGPQFKGGCEDIVIEKCSFLDAGGRPIQAGGSTGMAYFRPVTAKYEARRVIIRGNRIEGGDCACTFTGVDGAEFNHNTIIRPAKWFFRILTETRVEGFPPARNVTLTGNTFIYRRSDVRIPINIGADTAPETFKFINNSWYAEDLPEQSNPRLSISETGGSYGIKPQP